MSEGDEDFGPQRSEDPATGRDAGPALASEISRRVAAILDAVEREAGRLREEARADAARYLEDARRQADALVAERRRRIAAISDELVNKSEAVVARLDDAAPVRAGFESLVRALGDAAERLSREAGAGAAPPAPPAFHETWVPPAPSPPSPPPPPAPPTPAPVAPAPEDAPAGGRTRPPAAPPAPQPAAAAEPPRFRPVAPGGPSPFAPRDAEAATPRASDPPGGPAQPWDQAEDARLVAMQMAIAGSTRGEVRDHLAAVLGMADSGRVLDRVFGPGSPPEQRLPGTG